MKVRLTEAQFEMVQRMNEADVDLSKYYNNMKGLINEVNALYNKVTFATVAEFIDGDIDAGVIENRLYEINNIKHKLYKHAYGQIERIPDDEYSAAGYDYDMKIDNIDGKLGDKITSLELILQFISEMQTKNEDLGIAKVFSDIKKMEINPK